MAQLGIETSNILTSVTLTVAYMRAKHPHISKAITYCSELLKHELTQAGVECMSSHDDCESYDAMMYRLKVDPVVGAVIIGHDTAWHYNHSVVACIYLSAGCKFIASDSDKQRRVKGGRTVPSTGALCDSVVLGLSEEGGGISKQRPEVCSDYLIEYLT